MGTLAPSARRDPARRHRGGLGPEHSAHAVVALRRHPGERLPAWGDVHRDRPDRPLARTQSADHLDWPSDRRRPSRHALLRCLGRQPGVPPSSRHRAADGPAGKRHRQSGTGALPGTQLDPGQCDGRLRPPVAVRPDPHRRRQRGRGPQPGPRVLVEDPLDRLRTGCCRRMPKRPLGSAGRRDPDRDPLLEHQPLRQAVDAEAPRSRRPQGDRRRARTGSRRPCSTRRRVARRQRARRPAPPRHIHPNRRRRRPRSRPVSPTHRPAGSPGAARMCRERNR